MDKTLRKELFMRTPFPPRNFLQSDEAKCPYPEWRAYRASLHQDMLQDAGDTAKNEAPHYSKAETLCFIFRSRSSSPRSDVEIQGKERRGPRAGESDARKKEADVGESERASGRGWREENGRCRFLNYSRKNEGLRVAFFSPERV